MKKWIFFYVGLLLLNATNGQTNTFPGSGSVGIGTVSPAALLHVSGNASTSQVQAYIGYISNRHTGFNISTPATNSKSRYEFFNWSGSAAYSQVVFDENGNIGVGTASPASKLDVNGDVAIATNLMVGTGIYNSNYIAANPTATYFKNYSAATTATLLENGNFGIGTTTPGGLLEVRGHTSVSEVHAIIGYIPSRHLGFNISTPLTNSKTRYEFFNWNGSSSYTQTVFDENGNVGIGTTSPSEKLSVVGNAYINGNISTNGFITGKKVTVTQTGWSDYVFDDSYQLKTISSLESFIKQNRHLPEVPTEKEVEKSGINVGDTQALLLKKIEELTLYIIELNRKNKKLESEVVQIKKIIRKLTL